MSTGPSPIVPFLILVTLGLIVRGQSLKSRVSSLSNAEQAAFDFVLVIPLLALLLVYFSSKSMVVPLSLILVTYMVSKMVLGPLLLIFIIYLASVFFPPPPPPLSRASYHIGRESNEEIIIRDKKNECEWGLLWMLLVIFFSLSSLLYQGEGDRLGLVFRGLLVYFFYNLVQ